MPPAVKSLLPQTATQLTFGKTNETTVTMIEGSRRFRASKGFGAVDLSWEL